MSDNLEYVKCNYCGGDDYKVKYVKDGFNIVQCNNCSLVYVNPRLNTNVVLSQYDDEYFKGEGFDKSIDYETEYSKQLGTLDLNDWDANVIREMLENKGVDASKAKLLDAGCGMGLFLSKAKMYGFDVSGLEFSKYAAEFVKSKGINVKNATIDNADLPQNYYYVIVMKEVIEHLPDPKASLEKIYRALKPGGLLFMTTGNYDSPERKLRGKDWFYFMPTGHLYIFSNKTMRNYLTKTGFSEIKVTNQGDLLHQLMLDKKILDVQRLVPDGAVKKTLFYLIRFLNHYISSGMRIYAIK